MSSGFYSWSTTSATNASADSTINWAEGQAPSTVNDSARVMMSALAKYRDDCGPNIQTAGTSTAYTLTTNQVFDTLANLANKEFSCFMHATNGASPTMSVDGLTALPIVTDGSTAVPAGTLISGSVYTFVFSNSASKFYLKSVMGNPYNIPLGGMMDFIGSTAPNSSFVIPIGQAISRTTYATLFSLVSTTYGVGDGSTTFNVPDLVGRVAAMRDAGSARLSSTYFGGNPANLGAVGGLESSTLITGNLPAYTPSGTISNAITVAFNAANLTSASGGGNSVTTGNLSATGALNLNAATIGGSSTFTGTAQGGSATPIRTVQPTIIVNKILRII